MPSYYPLQTKGRRGLNTRARADQLDPGEAQVADNIDFSRGSVRQRRGYSNVLTGTKDSVYRGGPAGPSIHLQGAPWWVEHPENDAVLGASSGPTQTFNSGRFKFHARHGLAVIPEGAAPCMSLNPITSGGTDYGIEFTLYSDDFALHTRDPNDLSETWRESIVMAKQWSEGIQWEIVVKTEAASATADPVFYLCLRVWDGTALTATEFQYESGGSPASFFEPGRRYWFAFTFDVSAQSCTSWYWAEGDAAPVSSSQSYSSTTLDTNGNVNAANDGCPLVLGGRALYAVTGLNQGFNGVIGELSFYDGSNGNGLPTWDATYLNSETGGLLYESERSDADIDGAGTDLELYWSLSEARISETRFVLPRYTRGTATDNRIYLSGHDATWTATGGGKLGSHALAFLPSGPTGQEECFYRALTYQDSGSNQTSASNPSYGPPNSSVGVRVPDGQRYMQRTLSGGADYAFPDEISFRVSFRPENVTTGFNRRRVLIQLCRVRVGASANHSYIVNYAYEVSLTYTGGGLKLAGRCITASGSSINVIGTTNLVSGQDYVGVFTVAFGTSSGNVVGRLYLDGVREASQTNSATKPSISQNTQSTDFGENKNDEDGRDTVFPFVIGCDVRVTEGIGQGLRNFMFGAPAQVGKTNGGTASFPPRRWWAFHRNLTEKDPNDGTHYQGWGAPEGLIGSVQVWHKVLTDQEVARFVDRDPNEQEILAYGKDLISSWNFEEGRGNVAYDKGALGNHLRFHPYPYARLMSGPIARKEKADILGLWEVRTRTPREGVQGRDLYALAGGSVCKVSKDSSGEQYMEPISTRCFHYTKPLPTAFQFSDFFYIASGEGPVIRVSRGRVSPAGIAPPFSRIQNDNLGWQAGDRDGTFQITEDLNTGGSTFSNGDTWGYCITFYDAESGTESPPSRFMYHTVEDSGGVGSLELRLLPVPHDRHATRYRIYRTTKNGGRFFLLDEIPVSPFYVDEAADAELSSVLLDSLQNYPPPENARIGVTFGPRAVYAGDPNNPATIYSSKEGFPEACPIEYQITVAQGRSSEITGLHALDGRLLVFLQDQTFVLYDQGGDVAQDNLQPPPLSFEPLRDDVGCVSHHSIQSIDNVGIVMASERGLYRTDGVQFQYISDRIEPTYRGLDKSSYRSWHSVHWRQNDQYILFCSDGTVTGRNNLALIWDYSRDAYSVWRGIEARTSWVVEDEDTGTNRLYFADYLGQVWELDSPDAEVDGDGSTLTGTIQSGANTTSRVYLVGDGSLPTGGDGLCGVNLSTNGDTRRVVFNTDTYVDLETPLSTAPVTGKVWELGRIESEWTTGAINPSNQSRAGKVSFVEFNFEPNAGSTVDVDVQLDAQPKQTFEAEPASSEDVRAPEMIRGRGRRVKVTVRSAATGNPWEFTDMEIAYRPRQRAKWKL